MDRKFSVKYRPGVSRDGQQQRVATSSLNTTYDSSTDNDIFALGDAATGFNIDDLFKDFGMSLNQALQGQFPQMPGQPQTSASALGPTKVSYQLHKTTIPEEGESGSEIRIPPGSPESGSPSELPPKGHTLVETSTISPKPPQTDRGQLTPPMKQDIHVSTITKTLPDGRTVQTRIVRGPVQRKARILKINRELPNGETELLSTLQLPGDQEIDIEETVKNIVSDGKKEPAETDKVEIVNEDIKRDRKGSALEQYDNMPQQNHIHTTRPPATPIQAPLADISEELRPVSRRQSIKDKFREKFRSRSPSASSMPLTPTPSIGSEPPRSPFERVHSIGPIQSFDRYCTKFSLQAPTNRTFSSRP